jgi:hypothetical protein
LPKARAGAEAIKEHIVFCHQVNGAMFWTSEMFSQGTLDCDTENGAYAFEITSSCAEVNDSKE